MKKIVLLLLFTQQAFAYSVVKDAVVRDSKFNAKVQKVKLTSLVSENSFEGEHFKIVLGKSNEAISFNHPDEKLLLKAATTYYHLTKAKDFFIKQLQSEYVASFKPITIRLEIKNVFNELGHFANDSLNPQYNNALSIPGGLGLPGRGVESWEQEIWFRPLRKIHVDEVGGGQSGMNLKQILASFRGQTHMVSFERFLSQVLLGSFDFEGPMLLESIWRTAGSSIILEALYYSTAIAAPLLERKWYYLDSALIPEIIYHEFAHIALGDTLALTHSTPVNEGLADYFAGKIANSRKLALKIKKYNTFNGKKVKKSLLYRQAFERGDFANSDFVFGLLWNVGQVVGEKRELSFLYELRNKISTSSNIRDDLLKAIIDTCKLKCEKPMVDRYKLYKLFHATGF